mmetsp:Transcript_69940/g.197332  ORF Transcript_69940/g.197332 Transcript_69940/m.197332 type:complete len:290 (+) Transcript_69940:1054-1923(+)
MAFTIRSFRTVLQPLSTAQLCVGRRTEKTLPTVSSQPGSWVVLTSRPPALYTRNLRPSSVLLSRTGAEVPTSAEASAAQSSRACSRPPSGVLHGDASAPAPAATQTAGVQDAGKRGPAPSTSKSVLKKWSFLFSCTSFSALTRSRRLDTLAKLLSGGANKSPSSRLSQRCGLKISLRRTSSSFAAGTASPDLMPDQNGPRTNSSPAHTPAGARGASLVASPTSNWSRFRSTPLGPVNCGGPAVPAMSCGITRLPARAWAGSRVAWRPAALGASTEAPGASLSRPKSTPP